MGEAALKPSLPHPKGSSLFAGSLQGVTGLRSGRTEQSLGLRKPCGQAVRMQKSRKAHDKGPSGSSWPRSILDGGMPAVEQETPIPGKWGGQLDHHLSFETLQDFRLPFLRMCQQAHSLSISRLAFAHLQNGSDGQSAPKTETHSHKAMYF